MADYKFTDNSGKVKTVVHDAIGVALAACGEAGRGFASANLSMFPRVDTGRLRGSITYQVREDEDCVYVGTNVGYGKYVELGTGPMADGGGRTDVPWFYKGSDGKFHASYGMAPSHFMKRAATEHKAEYKQLIKTIVGGSVKGK